MREDKLTEILINTGVYTHLIPDARSAILAWIKEEIILKEENVNSIVRTNLWDFIVKWMPECYENDGHFNCQAYNWNDDETKCIKDISKAIYSEINAKLEELND